MEAKVIIVSAKKSNRSENIVWAVAITGEEPKAYCKSAYKAMRFAFLLKVRTGYNISENCLSRLSHEIALMKVEKAKAAWFEAQEQKNYEEVIVPVMEAQKKEEEAKPKKKRQPRSKKSQKSVQ